MPAPPKEAKPSIVAFSGAGHTLGGSASADRATAAAGPTATTADASGASSAEAGGTWAERPAVVLDESSPKTTLQVRMAGSAPQRFVLNHTHTVRSTLSLSAPSISQHALDRTAITPHSRAALAS